MRTIKKYKEAELLFISFTVPKTFKPETSIVDGMFAHTNGVVKRIWHSYLSEN